MEQGLNEFRKEIIGDCELYHGDCLEVMPHVPRVDLVVTDPPYGMMFRSNYRAVKHEKILNDDQLPLAHIYYAIERATRAAYVFCRWDNLQDMPRPKSVLSWVKNNWSMGDLKHEHGRQWEACCFYNRPDHAFVKRIPDVVYANKTGNDHHPTQKPVVLIEDLIAANVGETVMDPFMGSGTTGIACVNLGKKFIGIELDDKHFETACERIAEAYRTRPRLFDGLHKNKPEQGSLFG